MDGWARASSYWLLSVLRLPLVLGSGTSGLWAPGALARNRRAVGTGAWKDRIESFLGRDGGQFWKELRSPVALGQNRRAVGTSAWKNRIESFLGNGWV